VVEGGFRPTLHSSYTVLSLTSACTSRCSSVRIASVRLLSAARGDTLGALIVTFQSDVVLIERRCTVTASTTSHAK
jgi:hypothetical protein